LVNVFTRGREPLSGNPLCVFEDGRGLDAATMQALARQFNLSETTFILPSETAAARVRIFTPSYEMQFAGHPTLGTAHVCRAARSRRRIADARDAGGHDSRQRRARTGGRCRPSRPAGASAANPPRRWPAMLGIEPGDIGQSRSGSRPARNSW
jgi:predicted PhzF superfamily epimerase YddE/YHI9